MCGMIARSPQTVAPPRLHVTVLFIGASQTKFRHGPQSFGSQPRLCWRVWQVALPAKATIGEPSENRQVAQKLPVVRKIISLRLETGIALRDFMRHQLRREGMS